MNKEFKIIYNIFFNLRYEDDLYIKIEKIRKNILNEKNRILLLEEININNSNFELCFRNCFNNYHNKTLFNEMINYFNYDNIKESISSYISENINSLSYDNLINIISLINIKKDLATISIDKDISLLEYIFYKYPDNTLEKIEDINLKKNLINKYYLYFFKQKDFSISYDIKFKNINTLLYKKDWFTFQYNNEDMISFLSKKDEDKSIIIKEIIKGNNELKNYLKNRKNNFLVEYLSNNYINEEIIREYYSFIKKIDKLGLYELFITKNKHGLIDHILDINKYDNFYNIFSNTKNINFLKNLNEELVLSFDIEKLINFINKSKICFFYQKYENQINKKDINNFFIFIQDIVEKNNSIQKSLLEEIKYKLLLQKQFCLEGLSFKFKEKINNYPFLINNFMLFDLLIDSKNTDTKTKKNIIVKKEKELLNNIINTQVNIKNLKRL